MDVLLLKDVEELGLAGEVRDVAPGYARNYLIPEGLAQVATEATLKQADAWRQAVRARQKREEERLAELSGRIQGSRLRFQVKVGEEERIYGSVTAADIADALSRDIGETIDKRKVVLDQPLRELGTRDVTVRLSAGHEPRIKVVVEGEEEEEPA